MALCAFESRAPSRQRPPRPREASAASTHAAALGNRRREHRRFRNGFLDLDSCVACMLQSTAGIFLQAAP